METKTIGSLLLLLLCNTIEAQMTNTGVMSILPGTVVATRSDFDNTLTATFTNDGEFHVLADFNNDGLIGFTPGQRGYTRFEGRNMQSITGSAPSSYFRFYDLLFDNASSQPAFELSGDISISGNSDFLRGIVKTNAAGLVTYENGATYSNTDDESHVDGYVQKNGNEEFQYPIGNKGTTDMRR